MSVFDIGAALGALLALAVIVWAVRRSRGRGTPGDYE